MVLYNSSEYDATMREKYLKSGMGKRYLKNRLKRSLSLTGFTIIELIIVIAIIAVLSGIVIANVIPYNSKGKDSAIKEQIGQIRIAGTDYFNTYGSYIGMCDSGTGCFNAKSNIINLGGYVLSPRIASDKYCYDFKLSDNATKWCVDSMGYNGSIDNCTLLNFSCN
ncbi:MAG: prepilin-type N-terminal cleavage/methylation domain-containing protein [Candidatus Staskawiczbacteria bacterium]|nr:prepilin-type N-terminal cleavage/methylation domain-containing protein [Candidatus Staskawiczbacteria bacterium]